MCNILLQNHGEKYHHLFVDNYYTSIDLCKLMLEKKIYVTGTVRSNRRGLPLEIKQVLKRKNEFIASRCGQLLAINWVDRKQVRMLSTHGSAKSVVLKHRSGEDNVIPHIVSEYNNGMGGVDRSDQMTDHCSAESRTLKCWRKVVFHLIDRTITNAYICYKTNPNVSGKKMTHLQFIIGVVEGLIGEYKEPRKKVGRPSLTIPSNLSCVRHFIENIPDKKRRKCVMCAQNRTDGFKGSRVRTWCKDCGVGLCMKCFPLYHK